MVEHKTRFRSYASDPDGPDEDLTDISAEPAPFKFGRAARDAYSADPPVPLFLSDPDGEPEPEEFVPVRKGRMASLSSKILMAVVAASGVAMLFAWFSSDATHDIIVRAKASILASVPTPSATAQADAAQLTPGDLQLKAPAHGGAPPAKSQGAAATPAPVLIANAAPSREEIANAYQSALQARAPAAAASAVPSQAALPPSPAASQVATPAMPQAPAAQAKRIDPEELATLMKRAKDMLAMGDIPSARLLLERAAEGQDANAALMLARTYDPAVLGTSDVRNITPEPDKARSWYQKAAQLGSAEAQQRLAQSSN